MERKEFSSIRAQLITDIKTALPDIDLVDKYRGEFTEDSQWSPRDSACFLQALRRKPIIRAGDGTPLKTIRYMKVFAGGNFKHETDGLDVCETLIEFFDNAELTVEIETVIKKFDMRILDEDMDLIFYDKGFEGYGFTVEIINKN